MQPAACAESYVRGVTGGFVGAVRLSPHCPMTMRSHRRSLHRQSVSRRLSESHR